MHFLFAMVSCIRQIYQLNPNYLENLLGIGSSAVLFPEKCLVLIKGS